VIPAFPRVIKRSHHVYTHREIDEGVYYLSQPELPRGAIAEMSRDTGIPSQTLMDWRQKRIEEGGKNWFPLAQGHPQARGLSPENDAGITDFVCTNYVDTGKGATRGLLKSLCLNSDAQQDDHARHL
jgi:hypothetical protein